MKLFRNSALWVGVIMACWLAVGCTEPDETLPVLHDAQDVGLIGDAEAGKSDVEQGQDVIEPDVFSEQDPDVTSPINNDPLPGFETVPFDPNYWKQPNDCYETIAYPPGEEFFIPETASRQPRYLRRSDIIQVFGKVPDQAVALSSSNLHTKPFGHVYAQHGEDIVLHLLGQNVDPEDFIANLSVLLDYKPVEARLVRWEPERAHIVQEVSGSGMRFDVKYDVEVIDIVIPASNFTENRAYEVEISYFHSKELREQFQFHRRVLVYHGGFQAPSHPCFEPALELDVLTDLEVELVMRASGATLLFAEGIDTVELLRSPIYAERGQRLTLYYSLFNVVPTRRSKVAVPFMNGVAIGEPWYLSNGESQSVFLKGEDDTYRLYRPVDARKTFELTLPDEPGVYDIYINDWDHPYLPYYDLTGKRIPGVSIGALLDAGSNILRFVVE